jgi:Mg2+ and Co2+ transporter CorA
MSNNIDILLKLFATLKESSDKNEEATQQLILQQLDLVGHIKHLPIEDLRQALKDHAKDSASDIDSCEETVTTTSADLMTAINNVGNKVTKIILVVSVAFTIAIATYGIMKSFYSDKAISVQRVEEHRVIATEVVEIIRDEIMKLNSENKKEGN